MNFIKPSLLLVFITVIISSCLKQDYTFDGPKTLSVKFQNNTLDIEDFDSAVFVLNIFDTVHFTSVPLTYDGTDLVLDLTTLPAGFVYYGEVAMYAKADSLGKKYQYYYQIQFNPQLVNAITLPAPSISGQSLWTKRIILEDSLQKVAAIFPLKITDPYFEIKASTMLWDHIVVDREIYFSNSGSNILTGSAKFECTGGCFPSGMLRLINRTAFYDFAVENEAALWNNAKVIINLEGPNPDNTISLEYTWEK